MTGRKIDNLDQQHHGGRVVDQIGQRRRRQREVHRRVEIESALRKPSGGLVAAAGGLKRAGHHKQSHEEDENRPVHQTQQIVGAKFGAGEMNARRRQRDNFLGQRREKQADDRDKDDDSLDGVRAV